ncbi:hypothetical protein [Cohnella sp. GCM10027633]|uniref:hypothetical protein n=1 Tax=unclassified Cohnella TaxID=2636738 RepID=UPI003640F9F7
MTEAHEPDHGRKTYYVSVGAGQVLEDKEAAPFELVIRANEEELNKLQELFEETSSTDEAAAFTFSGSPTVSDPVEDDTYDGLIHDIYRMLHELGTDETKHHIESMDILR